MKIIPIAAGAEASKIASILLKRSYNITVNSSLGPIELKPGTIWSGDKMLLYCTPMTVQFMKGDVLYEWSTSLFIRDEYLNAMSVGAARATIWITVGKAEFALICGIFVPWYVMLGMTCAKAGLYYVENKKNVDKAFEYAPKVIAILHDIRRNNKTLWDKVFMKAAKNVLYDLPSGISVEDVAFFVGRCLQGANGLPEVTYKALTKIVIKVASLVTITHLPSITGHVVTEQAKELKNDLLANGIALSDAEAAKVLSEISNADTAKKLLLLEEHMKNIQPLLDQLKNAYGSSF